ncbi:MAG: hypothetical protein GX803_09795 [Lentisphaerae bacterium]|jgi:hypothetical protein|nr:hypothetical protein [Lentisphaerota bacterium]
MTMKIFPHDAFEIATPMSAEAIGAVLHDMVEPTKWLRLTRDHKTFQGTVERDGFKITRIIHYRNSFLPVVRGRFKPGPSGVTVAVTMRLHPFVTAFMGLWFGGVGVGIVAALAALVLGQADAHPTMLIPFGLLLIGWALVSGAFWHEANKTKPILLEMFQGTIRNEPT